LLKWNNPFAKAKGLIDDLITRVEEVATVDAKVHCAEQMAKTEEKIAELEHNKDKNDETAAKAVAVAQSDLAMTEIGLEDSQVALENAKQSCMEVDLQKEMKVVHFSKYPF